MLQNAITLITTTLNQLLNDVEYLQKKPAHNKLQVKIKQNQANNLQQALYFLNENQANQQKTEQQFNQTITSKEVLISKLTGCCLYYGISTFEVEFFCSRSQADITQLVKETLADNAYYKPLKHTIEKADPIKFATEPKIPFLQLFNSGLNHAKTN